MYRRVTVGLLNAVLLVGLAACGHNKKVTNPIADLNSKQPDKVLFDRALDAMKHNKFEVARINLQTLINTYPDSEFVARAKLAVGDSWYAEGNTAALSQAESEYKDFITFFPQMPEAAEAQMKIANIHYHQMEKPDRDYTHAKRAEEEYREMIRNFPDSKLVPEAKERLREVQEVLAEREYRIGRFYYLRESWPAAIARLKSVADAYPLYSGADESLFLLGDAYQREAQFVNSGKLPPEAKQRLVKDLDNHAAEAFSRVITRYPVTERADDAKKRLAEMKRPAPTPTAEAIAQNKAEEESRSKNGLRARMMMNLHKRPDVAETAKVGEPSLFDPKPTNAPDVVKSSTNVLIGNTGTNTVSVETTGTGAPPANEAAPHSEAAPKDNDPNAIPELTPSTSGTPTPSTNGQETSGAPQPAPPQVNEANQADGQASSGSSQNAAQSSDSSPSSDKNESSSKAKKKKGLRRIVPF